MRRPSSLRYCKQREGPHVSLEYLPSSLAEFEPFRLHCPLAGGWKISVALPVLSVELSVSLKSLSCENQACLQMKQHRVRTWKCSYQVSCQHYIKLADKLEFSTPTWKLTIKTLEIPNMGVKHEPREMRCNLIMYVFKEQTYHMNCNCTVVAELQVLQKRVKWLDINDPSLVPCRAIRTRSSATH